jgi:hypothetical protein
MAKFLTLKLIQGTSRDYPLQACNRDGTPAVGVFDDGDTLTTQVWAGDGQPVLLTPATTWADADAGQFTITFNDSDTSDLPPSLYQIITKATRSGRSGVILPRGTRLEILDAPGSGTATDLVTQDALAAQLAAGGMQLTTAQVQVLPALARSASRQIRRLCNRYFNRGGPKGVIPAFDGVYTIDWPSRTFLLRQYPINSPPRVQTNPTVVLTVWNQDSITNQAATVTLQTDGTVEDVDDVSPATTGLVLYRLASAVATSVTLTWADYPTIAALATAITNLGNGWSVTVADGYALRPTAAFRAGQGTQPALGFQTQVGFSQHVDDVPVIYDARSGIVTLSEQLNDPFTSPRFGIYLQTDLDDCQVYGGPQGLRVTYDAGWDVVPEDVQSACVETVIDWLHKLSIDQNLGSESDGARSYVINTAFQNYSLPKSVIGKLSPYRSPRA